MNVIYTSNRSSAKKRKPTAKQRELQADWEKLLKKYEPKKPLVATKDEALSYSLGRSARRETPRIPSHPFVASACTKAPDKVYTGSAIKGIGTMHKSNAVPVFSDEQAIEIATMRRG
jgi:hypothetical protein